jgi:ATP-dependent protease ClpP protease subunit
MRTLQPLRGALASLIICSLLLLAFSSFHLTAQAASIEVVGDETRGHPALILIKGRFLKSEVQHDVTAFETLAAIQKNSAIVFLESQGGMTWAALQIGKIIQRRGFSTAVADEAVCASACALIWLAGKERFMASTARVGFHASSTGENRGGEVSSVGNAIVGAYLYEIGLKELATIVYVTKASPQSMTWLTMGDAMRYGIAAKAFSLSQDEWSWARVALTDSGLRRHIDPPVPVPATRPAGSASDARMIEGRRVEEILPQAARLVSSGDVIGARDMLAAAEDGGQGPVTFALAETYDPNMLAAWGSRGVTSDVVRAKALYRKALVFGITKANMRLEALNSASHTDTSVKSNLTIGVDTPLRAEAASRVRLPIRISPREAVPSNSFVRIFGLPPAAALSEGRAIAPGSWAVPLIALPTLSVILPAGVQGRSDVAITLMSIDGGQLAEARMLLVVALTPVAPPATARPSPAASPSPMPLPPAERERALGLHEKGIEELKRGNVFAARHLFESATEAGLAQSAMALAATYDPNELAKLNNVGVVAEVDVARRWYEKARELGAGEAAERLRRLVAPNQRGHGYVAVLVSNKKSRKDALNAFAELQQKYGDVLAGKTPDVEEFYFGGKVLWYRVEVGPPGSREAAIGLCNQLKAAGYSVVGLTLTDSLAATLARS